MDIIKVYPHTKVDQSLLALSFVLEAKPGYTFKDIEPALYPIATHIAGRDLSAAEAEPYIKVMDRVIDGLPESDRYEALTMVGFGGDVGAHFMSKRLEAIGFLPNDQQYALYMQLRESATKHIDNLERTIEREKEKEEELRTLIDKFLDIKHAAGNAARESIWSLPTAEERFEAYLPFHESESVQGWDRQIKLATYLPKDKAFEIIIAAIKSKKAKKSYVASGLLDVARTVIDDAVAQQEDPEAASLDAWLKIAELEIKLYKDRADVFDSTRAKIFKIVDRKDGRDKYDTALYVARHSSIHEDRGMKERYYDIACEAVAALPPEERFEEYFHLIRDVAVERREDVRNLAKKAVGSLKTHQEKLAAYLKLKDSEAVWNLVGKMSERKQKATLAMLFAHARDLGSTKGMDDAFKEELAKRLGLFPESNDQMTPDEFLAQFPGSGAVA